MILFILCVQNGIEYSDDGTVLIRAPDDFSGDIVIPKEVITIGTTSDSVGGPFFKCKNNIRSLSFFPSAKVQNICSFCFFQSSLETVDMQYCTLLTYLNNSVFRLCQKLQTITLPPNLKEIGSGSLGWCGLRSITIPNSVVKIHHWSSQDGGAFTGSLYSVTINPESNLEIIGTESFVSSKIKSIFIPKKVTELYGSCSVSYTHLTLPTM